MKNKYLYNTEDELRDAFWIDNGHLVCAVDAFGCPKPQNKQPATTRSAWVDWLDSVARQGMISDYLAKSATL
jgi:hypothetical protein